MGLIFGGLACEDDARIARASVYFVLNYVFEFLIVYWIYENVDFKCFVGDFIVKYVFVFVRVFGFN